MSSENEARHFRIDESRMIDKVMALPEQFVRGWELAGPVAEELPSSLSSLIICGMGGSSIGGQLLRDLSGSGHRVSIHLERGYELPSFSGTDTPVICVSYSGNTEEVVSCFGEALSRGCPLAVITSGGILAEEARKAGTPAVIIPGGLPPRSAIGYLFAPLLRLASRWGIYTIGEEQLRSVLSKTSKLLARNGLDTELANNAALQLAKRLYGKTPLIYSGDGLLAGAGYRWKCQLNENSKSMAFFNTFPELGHNEVMAWDCPEKLRQDLFLIMLCDADDHPRVKKRMDAAFPVIESLAGGAVTLESEGGDGPAGRLQRLLSIVVMADLTSVYLAVEYGKDPTPVKRIEMLKKQLGSEDG